MRRALLREPVQRIGLGGYLHLVEDYPDFCDYIEQVADEFRTIGEFHKEGRPYSIRTKVAVLHYWGKLRSWTLSGHFHETYMNDLIHINEALSGLPVDVSFISFEDVLNGALENVDVVINAGFAGSAWSGGDVWKNPAVVEKLTRFVYEGGSFIGVNEPSAVAMIPFSVWLLCWVLMKIPERVSVMGNGNWGYRRRKGLCRKAAL